MAYCMWWSHTHPNNMLVNKGLQHLKQPNCEQDKPGIWIIWSEKNLTKNFSDLQSKSIHALFTEKKHDKTHSSLGHNPMTPETVQIKRLRLLHSGMKLIQQKFLSQRSIIVTTWNHHRRQHRSPFRKIQSSSPTINSQSLPILTLPSLGGQLPTKKSGYRSGK